MLEQLEEEPQPGSWDAKKEIEGIIWKTAAAEAPWVLQGTPTVLEVDPVCVWISELLLWGATWRIQEMKLQ